VATVVASIATQVTPRLAASTAAAIAARNSWTSTLCRAAARVVARPAAISPRSHAGVAAVASSPTEPITISMNSVSRSARIRPSRAAREPGRTAARASAAASISAADTGASQAVTGRQPASR